MPTFSASLAKRTYQFEQSAEATLGNSQPVPSLKVEQGATGGTC
jgi:hypothetical protein